MDVCKIFKALGDPTRYKMFLLLLERHHCPRSLAQALDISEAAVSQHMGQLKDCGLVIAVRHCRHVHYVVDEAVLARVRPALQRGDVVLVGHGHALRVLAGILPAPQGALCVG